ncbi:MAG: TIGR01212 family radical SAM protein [Candidatus Delongbacteria bacterium]
MKPAKKYYYSDVLSFMKKNYGKKLGKIGLSLNTPCPQEPPCIFCNKTSFIPSTIKGNLTVEEQIENGLPYVMNKYPTDSFIAYFQDNTSTYGDLNYLKRSFKTALAHPKIKLLALSTRPDCICHELLTMLKNISNGKEIWIELGLQSVHNSTLKAIKRNHSYEEFLNAFRLIRKDTDFKIGIHLIIGLPEESENMMFESFKEIDRIEPDYVKIHHLQVLKNTELERYYLEGEYRPLSLSEYIEVFSECLSFLNREIVIQRLLSRAHPDQLVAPVWGITAEQFKKRLFEYMDKNGLYQGSDRVN